MRLKLFCTVAANMVFAASASIAVQAGGGPCEVVIERACEDIPGNGWSSCFSVSCVNMACPSGNSDSGPTPHDYNETISEIEAYIEGHNFDGPYETFSSPGDTECRYSVVCDTCEPFVGTHQCAASYDPLLDGFEDPNVTLSMSKPLIDGEGFCFEEEY
ncbi:MAG: hypothetical protein AAGJ40_24130 [Planctomycetota bacterium]